MISKAQQQLIARQDRKIKEMYTRSILPIRDYEKIAESLGVSTKSVYRAIKRMGLPTNRDIQQKKKQAESPIASS